MITRDAIYHQLPNRQNRCLNKRKADVISKKRLRVCAGDSPGDVGAGGGVGAAAAAAEGCACAEGEQEV